MEHEKESDLYQEIKNLRSLAKKKRICTENRDDFAEMVEEVQRLGQGNESELVKDYTMQIYDIAFVSIEL